MWTSSRAIPAENIQYNYYYKLIIILPFSFVFSQMIIQEHLNGSILNLYLCPTMSLGGIIFVDAHAMSQWTLLIRFAACILLSYLRPGNTTPKSPSPRNKFSNHQSPRNKIANHQSPGNKPLFNNASPGIKIINGAWRGIRLFRVIWYFAL